MTLETKKKKRSIEYKDISEAWLYVSTVCPKSPFLKAFLHILTILLNHINFFFLNDTNMWQVLFYNDAFCASCWKVLLSGQIETLFLSCTPTQKLRVEFFSTQNLKQLKKLNNRKNSTQRFCWFDTARGSNFYVSPEIDTFEQYLQKSFVIKQNLAHIRII
jgi:hypothetical protein